MISHVLKSSSQREEVFNEFFIETWVQVQLVASAIYNLC